jgi:tetratricopeptide (TPR) repeat protein
MFSSGAVLVAVAALQIAVAREAERGNYDAALAHAERLGGAGHRPEAVARLQMRFARWHEAADSIETAARAEPAGDPLRRTYHDGLRAYALGMSAAQHGRIEEAALRLRELQAAVTLAMSKPRDRRRPPAGWSHDRGVRMLPVKARELEGFAASARGDHERALALLRDAVAMEAAADASRPSDCARPVLETLAGAAIRAGRFEEARAAYEAVLRMRPDSYHARRGLLRLTSKAK